MPKRTLQSSNLYSRIPHHNLSSDFRASLSGFVQVRAYLLSVDPLPQGCFSDPGVTIIFSAWLDLQHS